MKEYAVGNNVICSMVFKNEAGVIADPTSVFFSVKNSEGDVTNYTYGEGATIVKDSIGHYHVKVDASQKGIWHYRCFSTGSVKAAGEGSFRVLPSNFS